MGDFPAAAGVVTWRGGGLLITLILFCMAKMIIFRLTGAHNSGIAWQDVSQGQTHWHCTSSIEPPCTILNCSTGAGSH